MLQAAWDPMPETHRLIHGVCHPYLRPFVDHIGYFEATVTGASVGLTTTSRQHSFGMERDHYDPSRIHLATHAHIGWAHDSYGYHSDDGSKFRKDRNHNSGNFGEAFGEPFGERSRSQSLVVRVPCM